MLLSAASSRAQLVTNPAAIPDTGKPPVVFLNGYEQGCQVEYVFSGAFGIADQLLVRDNRMPLLFDNCVAAKNAPIETLGNKLGEFLNSLKYTDGRPVPQVDIVAHSMGGAIVRSYLAGKQLERGVFLPPAETHIRKILFLASPFFGSIAADLTSDPQAEELRIGSPFIFDLATWNQGTDDLRGVDALALVGTGGTGVLNGKPGFDDSAVTVTSASLEYVYRDRTRVVPYCHVALTGLLSIACSGSAQPIARMTSDQQDAAKAMLSFFAGTDAWMSVGVAPSANQYLKDRGGLQLQFRDSRDQIVEVSAATPNLNIRSKEIVWADDVMQRDSFAITATIPSATAQTTVKVQAGLTQALTVTTGGPNVAAVIPNFSVVFPRAVAPGSFLSIYGSSLATGTAQATTTPYPTNLGGTEVRMNNQLIGVQYASPTQINAVVPDGVTGLVKLNVRNSSGERTVNVLIESAVPSLYPTAVNGRTFALITKDAPAHGGDVISIFLTGLGLTDRRADGLNWARIQPTVTYAGQTCTVTYAGRAPGFIGLDQINCQLPATVAASDTGTLAVTQGRRTATLVLPTR